MRKTSDRRIAAHVDGIFILLTKFGLELFDFLLQLFLFLFVVAEDASDLLVDLLHKDYHIVFAFLVEFFVVWELLALLAPDSGVRRPLARGSCLHSLKLIIISIGCARGMPVYSLKLPLSLSPFRPLGQTQPRLHFSTRQFENSDNI
jgi:hypothetical protein